MNSIKWWNGGENLQLRCGSGLGFKSPLDGTAQRCQFSFNSIRRRRWPFNRCRNWIDIDYIFPLRHRTEYSQWQRRRLRRQFNNSTLPNITKNENENSLHPVSINRLIDVQFNWYRLIPNHIGSYVIFNESMVTMATHILAITTIFLKIQKVIIFNWFNLIGANFHRGRSNLIE